MNGAVKHILAVIRREFGIWSKRPIYLMASIIPLAVSTIFFVSFFHAGMPSDLPVAVVDLDNSSMSRNFVRQLDATQLGKVQRYAGFAQAREAMQEGKVSAICVLPEHMYADLLANRRPEFTFYVNGLYFISGAMSYKNILTMINLTSGAVQRENLRAHGVNEHSIGGILRPVDIDAHQIGNPTTDYGIYLVNGLLPGVLQMTVILILLYSFGAEMKYGSSKNLMAVAGGHISCAVAGKLVIYTVLFCALGWGLMGLLFLWLGFPLAGNFSAMLLDVTLLVLASEAVALVIISLIPVCRFALSIGALYTVMAFSMSGFSLPVESMLPFLQGFSSMFPLRHYYQFFVQEAFFGAGFAGWWTEVLHLGIFILLPALVLWRLKKAYINQDYPKN